MNQPNWKIYHALVSLSWTSAGCHVLNQETNIFIFGFIFIFLNLYENYKKEKKNGKKTIRKENVACSIGLSIYGGILSVKHCFKLRKPLYIWYSREINLLSQNQLFNNYWKNIFFNKIVLFFIRTLFTGCSDNCQNLNSLSSMHKGNVTPNTVFMPKLRFKKREDKNMTP